jgi:hypothetical protein
MVKVEANTYKQTSLIEQNTEDYGLKYGIAAH